MWKQKENPLKDKSFSFAVRVVKVYVYLSQKKKEFVMSKQLLRSGTSIGANIEEAMQAQSKRDFIAKLQISLKESFETKYWIRLLHATSFLTDAQSESLTADIHELMKLLTAILKTSKDSIRR